MTFVFEKILNGKVGQYRTYFSFRKLWQWLEAVLDIKVI